MDEESPQEPRSSRLSSTRQSRLIVFTSGTSGEPRGPSTPRATCPAAIAGTRWPALARRAGLVYAATGGRSRRAVFVAPWLCGAAALVHGVASTRPSASRSASARAYQRPRQAPTEYRMLAKRTELPAEGRHAADGLAGEPLNPEVIGPFAMRSASRFRWLWQPETGRSPATSADEPVRDGSMGGPCPASRRASSDGELQVRTPPCPPFFSGYLTVNVIRREWCPRATRFAGRGRLSVYRAGRDDLILSAGYRIGPFEVESALVAHPRWPRRPRSGSGPERGAVVRAISCSATGSVGGLVRGCRSTSSARRALPSSPGSLSSPTSCEDRERQIKRAELRAAGPRSHAVATRSLQRTRRVRRHLPVTLLSLLRCRLPSCPSSPNFVRGHLGEGDFAVGVAIRSYAFTRSPAAPRGHIADVRAGGRWSSSVAARRPPAASSTSFPQACPGLIVPRLGPSGRRRGSSPSRRTWRAVDHPGGPRGENRALRPGVLEAERGDDQPGQAAGMR